VLQKENIQLDFKLQGQRQRRMERLMERDRWLKVNMGCRKWFSSESGLQTTGHYLARFLN
jgi:hypothetical protein